MMERFGSDKISRCTRENYLHRFCVFHEKASFGSHKCVDLYLALKYGAGKDGDEHFSANGNNNNCVSPLRQGYMKPREVRFC